MNHVRHRFVSQTYATRSCRLTVVAIRFHVPIDRSVHGMMVTADVEDREGVSDPLLVYSGDGRHTFILVNETVKTGVKTCTKFRRSVRRHFYQPSSFVLAVLQLGLRAPANKVQ